MAKFRRFCTSNRLVAMPASTATVIQFIVHLFREGRVHGTSLTPYLAAINRAHVDAGHPAPAVGPQVTSAKRGLNAIDGLAGTPVRLPLQFARRPPAAPHRAPLPATVALDIVRLGLSTTDPVLRVAAAAVTHAFVFFARASSAMAATVDSYCFQPDGSLIFRQDVSKRGRGAWLRTLPCAGTVSGDSAHPLLLLRRVYDMRRRTQLSSGRTLLFTSTANQASPSAQLDRYLQRLLLHVHAPVPAGFRFSSHSLRAGAATAALSINVPQLVLMAWGGWRSTTSLPRYVDPLVAPSPAARIFFGHLLR
jgi:hypothetical protein